MLEFSDLEGQTIKTAWRDGNDRLYLDMEDGMRYVLWHIQDCCEDVYIAEIHGDLADLSGGQVTLAAVISNEFEQDGDLVRYTFYKLDTSKGGVTIRWNGRSNGYYSVGVDFTKVES